MSGFRYQLLRSGEAVDWNRFNPVLNVDQLGLDTTNGVLKIGDGNTRWALLRSVVTNVPVVLSTGEATLVAGSVTVADEDITDDSVIRLVSKTLGGSPGALFISAKVADTSFTIDSTDVGDTSVVQYDVLVY